MTFMFYFSYFLLLVCYSTFEVGVRAGLSCARLLLGVDVLSFLFNLCYVTLFVCPPALRGGWGGWHSRVLAATVLTDTFFGVGLGFKGFPLVF